ncbi:MULTISPECIES: DUF2156 domain-containing protein [unclassified Oleiphilus]|uniref:DUF2156 domain-containing protein n=4 Tax=Oleiphilus TaxID=141450 RepID=UPI0007C2D3E9|nr:MULTISPECIES: DUF2156 domain-containing protein [unclassified Oleiphilus]KZY41011.1 hypothetical protein A3732_03265 [Oleiphilus sp. HI0050]KZY75376.1 hypothetical protein A3741_24110 [Oleiphilus sp. HI0069]KZY80157.1 hypothetical protein A3740_06720 [Oleiphilus sp. HI0068]KZY88473.1 hypothetical protein A3743_11695 [Oleiphilus sp. HI0072]KZY39265.1 hypothetical protein A3729_15215 [Oleiphilus sp. HI0043]
MTTCLDLTAERSLAASATKVGSAERVLLPFKEDSLSTEDKQSLLQRYGCQSSSYFNLQAGVQHFGSAHRGYVSYFRQRFLGSEFNIAFTRPVCADEDFHPLLDALEASTKRPSIFMAVDADCASALIDRGYRCNDMGVEYSLSLNSFDVKGKEKKYLRWASNFGRRGFVVKEQAWSEVNEDRVRDISERWRQTKAVTKRELRLITRPPEYRDAWGVRKFFCYLKGELVGYVFFDPYFQDDKIIGYTANIIRACPGIKPNGFLDYTILEAMKVFQKEGVARLSLGLAPLHELQSFPHEIASLRYLQQLMYRYGSFLYAFQALAYHKTRYRAQSEHWFQCIPPGISLPKATIATLKAIQVF